MLTIMALAKVPLAIYIVITLTTIPAIEATGYKAILGAHRGNSTEFIENTLPAIQSAVKQEKYQFIEFDIQYTKDKKIVVHHDLTLLRMQQKTQSISNLTHEELQNISNYSIPLYDDVIDTIENKKRMNIEIKSSGNLKNDTELVDYVVSDAIKRGILDNIMISSISSDIIKYVSETYPDIKTGKIYWVIFSTYLNFDFLTQNLYDEMSETGADYLMLHGSNIHNIDSLLKLKPENKTLVFWYFTDEMYVVQKDSTDQLW